MDEMHQLVANDMPLSLMNLVTRGLFWQFCERHAFVWGARVGHLCSCICSKYSDSKGSASHSNLELQEGTSWPALPGTAGEEPVPWLFWSWMVRTWIFPE